MSQKLRILPTTPEPKEHTFNYVVQLCHPGEPWETLKEFSGDVQDHVLKQIHEEFPKARFR